MKITLDESNLIQNAAFAFGGMAPFTVMALKTMKGVNGRSGEHFTLEQGLFQVMI